MIGRAAAKDRIPTVCIYQRFMPPDSSGAGKQALTLARVVRDAGWDVLFLTDGPNPVGEPLDMYGFPAFHVAPPPPHPTYLQTLAYWWRIGRAMLKLRHRFDLLHVHSAEFHQSGAVPLVRLLGKPALVRSSISGEFAGLSRSRSGRLQRLLLRRAGVFVALSRRLEREFEGSGLPRDRVQRIPNGVDTEVYHPVPAEEKRALRRQLDLPERGRIMVFHGVFIARKSLDWLVRVIDPRLEALDLTLLLVGGPARDEERTGYARRLSEQVAQSGKKDKIIVRGADPAVHRYLKASDVYVLPSTGEGLPNALLEAMAVGLLPIVTRTSGSEDVIDHRRSGFLFEPRDETSFLRCVEEALGPGGRSVGKAAAEQVREHFSIRKTGMRYVELYERLLS